MTEEQKNFEYFKKYQLVFIDYKTGRVDVKRPGNSTVFMDVGSRNPDGYIRLWCEDRLRMKHRLIYYLYHGVLPEIGFEIDHIDNVRDNNCISNLRIVAKGTNNSGCCNRSFPHHTAETIRAVCKDLAETNLSDQTIADFNGVTRATVRDIKTRRTRRTISKDYSWPHRGY